MTLTDTGPIVALIDRRDPYHQACRIALASLPRAPMLTTWPCFTEAMHMLGRAAGANGQDRLRELVSARVIQIAGIPDDALGRMAELMRKYSDQPMDLADASLIVVAEQRALRRVSRSTAASTSTGCWMARLWKSFPNRLPSMRSPARRLL